MIYLKHSIHGIKIITMELEAVFDEQHGWVRFDPSEMNISKEGLTHTPPVIYNKIISVAIPTAPPKKVK